MGTVEIIEYSELTEDKVSESVVSKVGRLRCSISPVLITKH